MGYEVAVTPLQLALAYSAIANDGILIRPSLVRQVRDPGGAVVWESHPEPVRRAISSEVAAELRTALSGVVYDGGTAGIDFGKQLHDTHGHVRVQIASRLIRQQETGFSGQCTGNGNALLLAA